MIFYLYLLNINSYLGNCILSRGGSGGGWSIDLLWTNSSPTAAFATQTVTIDLSDYTLASIQTVYSATDTNNYKSTFTIHTKGTNRSLVSFQGQGSGYAQRYLNISDTGIWFSTAYGIGGDQNTALCVPLYIYGIK